MGAIEPAPAKGEIQKKTQAQFDRKEFSWRKIMHVLQSGLSGTSDGGFVTEVVFSPTPLRMYTDHRVMGAMVLPGVSHMGLMAATGLVGYQDGSMPGRNQEQCAVVKEVLFERPYVVSAGTEILAAVGDSGYQPNPSGPALGTEVPGSSMTYCRSMSVAGRSRPTRPSGDWWLSLLGHSAILVFGMWWWRGRCTIVAVIVLGRTCSHLCWLGDGVIVVVWDDASGSLYGSSCDSAVFHV